MNNQKTELIRENFKIVSSDIIKYRENKLKQIGESTTENGETHVELSRPADCLDLRQMCTPEQVREMMCQCEDLYDVDKLVRYCFHSTILQLKRGVLNGITIENFMKEKSKK